MPPPAMFTGGGIPAFMFPASRPRTPTSHPCPLRQTPSGTWYVTYRVRLRDGVAERIRRPLDTKRLHTARLRREALIAQLGLSLTP